MKIVMQSLIGNEIKIIVVSIHVLLCPFLLIMSVFNQADSYGMMLLVSWDYYFFFYSGVGPTD